jgi:hypothetical protein
MFPTRYFANRYFAPRYFPKVGAAPGAGGLLRFMMAYGLFAEDQGGFQ